MVPPGGISGRQAATVERISIKLNRSLPSFPPERSGAGEGKTNSFPRRVLFAPEFCHAIQRTPPSRIASRLEPAVGPAFGSIRLGKPRKKCQRQNKKEAERRQARISNLRTPTLSSPACGGGQGGGAALPPPEPSACGGGNGRGRHAFRRSTAALAKGTHASQRLSFGPGFPRRGADKRRSSPRRRRPRLQRCTSRAGHSAGRLMPKPPGSGGDEPPPAGTALAPSAGVAGRRP